MSIDSNPTVGGICNEGEEETRHSAQLFSDSKPLIVQFPFPSSHNSPGSSLAHSRIIEPVTGDLPTIFLQRQKARYTHLSFECQIPVSQ